MAFEFNFGDLWWPAIVVGTVSYIVLSMIWYTPRLFGAMWMADEGLTEEEARAVSSPALYISTFLMAFVSNVAIALILNNIGDGLTEGLVVGLVLGVGVAAMAMGPHYMFAGKPNRLALIQMGHSILLITVSGVIIGAWTG